MYEKDFPCVFIKYEKDGEKREIKLRDMIKAN